MNGVTDMRAIRRDATAMAGASTGSRPDRRLVLGAAVAALATPALASPLCAAPASAGPAPRPIRVGPRGDVATLGAALDRAARLDRAVITLAPGVYDEKLTVVVPGITIRGEGPGVVLSHAAGAGSPRPGGGGNWGTSGSAVLTIAAPDVTLRDLTIRNSHDYLSARMQAVALAIGREGDRTRVIGCTLDSWQDTLLIQARAHFDRCRILGIVDYVFGGGAAWIGRSTIVNRFVPDALGGFIAAPSTPQRQPYGLVFADCRLEREAGVADGSIWLGRPWRAGGNMDLTGHAAFLRCWMDAHIQREGWTAMGFRDPAGERQLLQPEQARLFEAASRGPGAGPATARRRAIAPAIYKAMTPVTVLGGWAG